MPDIRRAVPCPSTASLRKDHELPEVTARAGWRYHHLGIPTQIPHPAEKYLADFRMFVSGFETSPYGIEWMRFEENSPLPELVRTVPHVAFLVDNLESALEGKSLLSGISAPSEGVRIAMIADNGAPVELMEFRKTQE